MVKRGTYIQVPRRVNMKSPLITSEAEWKKWVSHVEALPVLGSVTISPISYPCICVIVSNTLGSAIEMIYEGDFNLTPELAKAKEALKLYHDEKQKFSVAAPASG